METGFFFFLKLGFEHISDLNGYDHMLFIIALCAVYQVGQWRNLLWLVTAFTIGHSVTLALATLQIVQISPDLIEFLIPVTILLSSLVNIYFEVRKSRKKAESWKTQYAIALGFGLIHGLGFSNYLRAMLGGEESILAPLLAFNIGLELGQLLILAVLLAITWVMINGVRLQQRDWVLLLSGGTAGAALLMILEAATNG